MNDLFKNLKLFDIDPALLRSKFFYKNLLKERESYWEEREVLLKNDSQAECILCGSIDNELDLEYKKYKLFKCGNCGAVFPNILIDESYNKLVYDNNIYEENIKREVLDSYEYRKEKFGKERLEYIKEKCKFNLKNDTLLDLGCGPGYFLKHLTELNVECRGLELTQYLVDICKDQNLNVDATLLENEKDDSYSVITMFDVLEHLTRPIDFFKVANKKLHTGGRILAYTPNINSFSFYFQKGGQNLLLPYEHVVFYDKKSLDYLASKSGFKVESVEFYGLDLIDYLSMKEYEDGVLYNENLKEVIPYLQALIDKEGISNHMRIIFKKI